MYMNETQELNNVPNPHSEEMMESGFKPGL